MSWVVPVLLRIASAYIVAPLFSETARGHVSAADPVLLQFVGCFVLALPVALALQHVHLDWRIVAVGFGNGLAAYCYYKAIAISLSRTAISRSGMT